MTVRLRKYPGFRNCWALGTVALLALPAAAEGQRATPVGITRSEVASGARLIVRIQAVEMIPLPDSTERPSAGPYVITGAVLGALVMVLLYQDRVDEGFAFPLSLILPVSIGAIIGAYIGFVLRPL